MASVCACGEYFNVDETGELCLNPDTMGLRKTVQFGTPGTFKFLKADYPWLARIRVKVQAGGGGSAGAEAAAKRLIARPGGSGGGYSESVIEVGALADVESVVVGAGGAGGLGNNPGTAGGASSFGGVVTAVGGNPGGDGMVSDVTNTTLLARDERPPSTAAGSRPTNLDLGGVQAELDSLGLGVGEPEASRPRLWREQPAWSARLHRPGDRPRTGGDTETTRSSAPPGSGPPGSRYACRALGPRRISVEECFMTDRLLTLMAVHAHPDDEATGTGGVLARYAAEGIRTVLVTCTDGGCGDGPGGVKPGDPGHDPAAVALMRRQELEASCDVLKVSDLEMLDYADSGMIGWPSNDAPGSFWQTPVEEGAARLAELMRHYRPDVVVTYDENGFYGHPDHIQAHRITMAALGMTALAPKVYWTTMPRSMMQRFGETMREFQGDMPEPDPAEAAAMAEIGLPDDEITTWVDTIAFSGQKFDALAAHASQGENIFFLKMGKERFGELMGMETFVRVQDATGAAIPENDLFAGLR